MAAGLVRPTTRNKVVGIGWNGRGPCLTRTRAWGTNSAGATMFWPDDPPIPRAFTRRTPASEPRTPRATQARKSIVIRIAIAALLLATLGARASADEEDPDERHRSGLTGGVGLYGSLTAALFGEQVGQRRENGVGGGGVLMGQFGWFLSETVSVVLDGQLSLQRFSVGEGVTSFNSVIAVDLVGLTSENGFLLGGIGVALGQRSDWDNPDGQSFGVGIAPTAGAGYDFWEFGAWTRAAELRFTAHIYPSSDSQVTMLQWAAGVAVHRR